jgi:CTP synthase
MVTKGASLWELWKKTIKVRSDYPPVEIALVGKYTKQMDSYLSLIKALEHAAMRCNRKLNLVPVDSEQLEGAMLEKEPTKYYKAWDTVCSAQGVSGLVGYGCRSEWAYQDTDVFSSSFALVVLALEG